ncbi:MAG: DUF1697 domain-containing protein [Candidatus Micrarchaeia archaeon]|jgi:uncharacterized protein (DUF1697 family)
MRYVALLRGINVGGNRKVEMKRLKALFESLGYSGVSTYINSGNVVFESGKKHDGICKELALGMKKEFGFDIQTLVKTEKEMKGIADAIPKQWQNDSAQKTDVAYLFREIDSAKTIDGLPVKKEYIDIRYAPGAIFWNVERKNYNKSHLNKIISHPLYKMMTVRNVNTARFLARQK